MKNIPLLVGTIAISILMIVGLGWLFGRSAPTATKDSQELLANRAIAESGALLVKGDPATAKVVIAEFSDFQCPACQAASPLVQQVATQYGSDVAILFRHLPLVSIHPNAFPAALAAQAASQQGKFWEMHDILFAKQTEWSEITDQSKLQETFIGYARELDMNQELFASAMADATTAQAIQADMALADQLRINATPTFFVNGQSVNASGLQAAVEQALTNTALQVETLPIETLPIELTASQAGSAEE